jgi:hypothetical protein
MLFANRSASSWQTPSVHESAAPQFQVTREDKCSGMVIEICVGALRTVRGWHRREIVIPEPTRYVQPMRRSATLSAQGLCEVTVLVPQDCAVESVRQRPHAALVVNQAFGRRL